ncbi:AN1-type zinc finger domain-containing protein [Natranaeroarchaeum sulfidigenes]|uniref:AN1-type zinc finger domain-containing protein n=1 Tax=Natranaeroarchaeum sulfidigenes TaxID=2784880 RepID=UPI001EE51872|nr:AN1-type zinc finger domain-containing protein [Natranaeroarchaeum sulfidigenes]
MAACDICGETSSFDYSCRYCDGTFCNKHQLPERHNCVYLGSAKTLGPELRDFDGEAAHQRVSSDEGQTVDRREERDTTDCEGCGETIDASRTYCPDCRLELADIDQTDGPEVVVDNSPEPDSLANRTRNIDSDEEDGIQPWVVIGIFVLVVVMGASVGLFILL